MRRLRNGIAALIIGFWPHSALVAPAFAQTCACAPGGGYVIEADEPPPPLPEYDQPPLPRSRLLLDSPATGPGTITTITGSPASGWSRRNRGCCGRPAIGPSLPAPTPSGRAIGARMSDFMAGSTTASAITAPAIWAADGTTGGILQHRANNLGPDWIANVYSQPSRQQCDRSTETSFNGGAGGVAAKPTNEELLAEKETHVPPTRLQVDHARSSSMRGRSSSGRPITASPRSPPPRDPASSRARALCRRQPPASLPKLRRPQGEPASRRKRKGLGPTRANRKEPAPSAPRTEEMRTAAGQPMKSEAPTNAPRREKRPPVTGQPVAPETPANVPRTEERAPNLAQPVEARGAAQRAEDAAEGSTVGQPGKPEAPANAPRFRREAAAERKSP